METSPLNSGEPAVIPSRSGGTGPRPKVLLITPRFPFPSLSGGEKWAARLAEGLAENYDLSLFSFTSAGAETHQTALAMKLEGKLFRKIYLLPKPENREKTALPSLPAMYWSPEAAAALGKAAAETGAELAHILFSEMACYEAALPPGLPLVYTEIDSSYLYPWKYYLRETAGLKGFFKAGEFLRSRAYARRHYGRFNAVTFITASDGRDIARYLKTALTAVTPNAVRAGEFSVPPGNLKNQGEILFLGHYPHYPNEDAALRLARRIFPLVKAEFSRATLTLAGSFPTRAVAALAGHNVSVPGTAADIRPFFWRAEVFAAPVRYGLGAKGKILEAFAAGLPVVASREAAAGIEGAADGVHLLVAGSDREFAAKTALLLKDPARRAELAANAQDLARKKFSFEGVTSTIGGLYGELLNGN